VASTGGDEIRNFPLATGSTHCPQATVPERFVLVSPGPNFVENIENPYRPGEVTG
jgi:hypothetical protein